MISRYYNAQVGRWLNADSAIGQIGNVQSYNMFAYCFNNPVDMSDPTGNWPVAIMALTASTVIPYAVAAVVLSCVAAVAVTAIANGEYSDGLSVGNIATQAATAVGVASQVIGKIACRDNVVYVLEDADGTVQYVGRTKHEEKRRMAHKANPERADLKFTVLARDLTYVESRALEQAGIAYHHTINTANKMNNQINGVAPKYWDVFKEIALGTLNYAENQMTNEILYWTGN